jgi:hypothetical protein
MGFFRRWVSLQRRKNHETDAKLFKTGVVAIQNIRVLKEITDFAHDNPRLPLVRCSQPIGTYVRIRRRVR